MKVKRAFLLIELLISISIFLISIFIITKYKSIYLQNNLLAVKKTEALNLALNLIKDKKIQIKNLDISKRFKITTKEINYMQNLSQVVMFLKNLFGSEFVVNDCNFKLQEVSVEFDLLNKKKGEIVIKG